MSGSDYIDQAAEVIGNVWEVFDAGLNEDGFPERGMRTRSPRSIAEALVAAGWRPVGSRNDAEQAVLDGAALIAAERQRQIGAEGWTPEHDDEHDRGELIDAARAYAEAAHFAVMTGRADVRSYYELPPDTPRWPWGWAWWKPSDDPVRNLVKAGALIAAEIDRLQRAAASSLPSPGGETSCR